MRYVALFLFLISITSESMAKEKQIIIRKTQNVDFEGDTVDGKTRTPDGAYIVQKRSVDFVPLYKVRESFDENIFSSVEHLK
ncbi:MAG: hypothetical protein IT289_09400 [Oligoflexia bacterium]|nr:hypothetical protein [Oligoflexia bacterium]